jgi:MoaA/NifB/PqqE/SkfB family radical SAM enzyme
MSYITENKLLHYLDRVKGDNRPVTAELFLTNFCNHRCGYCRFHHGKGYIDFEHFKQYAERLLELGVQGFILTGGGEPILNPDFDKITGWLEENNLEYGINTNFSKLKRIKPIYLKVSIDATTPEQYEEFRGVKPHKYLEMIDNVKEYRKWQKQEGHNTTLGIQTLVMDEGHAANFYLAHRDLDVDYMVFRPMESRKAAYDPDKARKIRREINNLSKVDKRVLVNYKWDMLTRRFETCFAAWSVLTINWNGEVQYCCHKPQEVVGHIMDRDILKKKQEFKTNMRTCENPCRLSGSNAFLEAYEEEGHNAFV